MATKKTSSKKQEQPQTSPVTPRNQNMIHWDKLSRPPADALKEIRGGRLKGKTDINPMWRYQAMTEEFGIVGDGWKYEIVNLWTVPAANNQMFAYAQVNLYVKRAGGEWGEAIPGIGGSMMIEKESAGLHSNDEAYKMAVTDALSVAMKMLGVAAEIYAGRWDGSKYMAPAPNGTGPAPRQQQQPRQQQPAQQQQRPPAPAINDEAQIKNGLINSVQVAELKQAVINKGIVPQDFAIWKTLYVQGVTGKAAPKITDIPNSVYGEMYDTVIHDMGDIKRQADEWRAKQEHKNSFDAPESGDDGVA